MRWVCSVLRRRYCVSDNGVRREMDPVVEVRRRACEGIVAFSAAVRASEEVEGMKEGALVVGIRVIVVLL